MYEWEVKVRPIPAPSWARFGLSDGRKGLDPDCGRPDGPGKGPRTGVTASCPRSPRQVGTARDPRCFFVVRGLCSMCQIRSSQVLEFVPMLLGELVQPGSCKMLLPTYPLPPSTPMENSPIDRKSTVGQVRRVLGLKKETKSWALG